jgi:hypothetical protein
MGDTSSVSVSVPFTMYGCADPCMERLKKRIIEVSSVFMEF